MKDPLITTAIITLFGNMVMSVLAFLSSRRNAKSIQAIHVSVNSRLSELLAASIGKASAEAREEGREAGRLEQNEENGKK